MKKLLLLFSLCISFCAFSQGNTLSSLTAKAKSGDIEAQYNLGRRYLYDSHRGDDEKAVKQGVFWIEKSAKAGYPKAQFSLAELIESLIDSDLKNSFSQRYKESDAVTWYRKAAQSGVKEAYSRAGVIFYRAGNNKEAFSWFSAGVKAGDLRSYHWLATMYNEGQHVKKDPQQAFKFNLYAAERGDKYAMQAVSEAYMSGSGVKRDTKKAEFWDEKQELVEHDRSILE